MENKKAIFVIDAHVEDVDSAKELLCDLEALLQKYDVTIDLKIHRDYQALYELT